MAQFKVSKKRAAPAPKSSRVVKKPKKIPATRLENGLLSMQKTPEHLVETYVIYPS